MTTPAQGGRSVNKKGVVRQDTRYSTASSKPAKPRLLSPELQTIPAALRDRSQWCVWRLEFIPDREAWTKVPYQTARPSRKARSNDPTTWGTFDQACTALKKHSVDGVGFFFGDSDGLTGIDLDHCLVNGRPNAETLQILQHFPGAYCELSPSGSGLHVFVLGKPGRCGKCEGKQKWIEVYDHSSPRYLTITGHMFDGAQAKIMDGQAGLNWLHSQYFTPQPKRLQAAPRSNPLLTDDDADLLAKARAAKNSATFTALWQGGGHEDASSGDFALCGALAFWTNKDAARIDRLFRQSGRMRAKWDHKRGSETYGELTIRRAIDQCADTYSPSPPPSVDRGSFDPNNWPEPQPLIAQIAPEPYPLDALPDSIRAAVVEAQSFIKAPIPLVASSALGALSLAVQAHVDVKRAEQLTGPASLFLLTIADSGERKSSCDGFFTQALRDYQNVQYGLAKPDLANHQADMGIWESKRTGLKEKIRQLAKTGKPTDELEQALRDLEHDKPEPPRVPRLLYTDATPESLAYGLAKQWPAAGICSSEAGLIFGAHGMGEGSIMRNLALLNSLWDGTTITIDRRTKESFTVRGARLTVALQIQEPTLKAFFEQSGELARGSGFLARFLIAWPESTQGFRPFSEPPDEWPALNAFSKRVTTILNQPAPIDDDGGLTPALMHLPPPAKAAWIVFHDVIESELKTGGELFDVRDCASKIADSAARLAGLFQYYEAGTDDPVNLGNMEGACRIAAWHLNEARRFFGELALPPETAELARLDSWLLSYCRQESIDKVPTRTVLQYGPSGLRSKESLDGALQNLCELGRARVEKGGKQRIIRVHPELLTKGIP